MDISRNNGYSQLLNVLQQNKNTQPEDFARQIAAAERQQTHLNTTAATTSYEDKVSLSSQAARLNDISQELLGSKVQPDSISDIAKRLYLEGMISEQDLSGLTGGQTNSVSVIGKSVHFLNRFVNQEAIGGDSAGAAGFVKVVDALQKIDLPTTPERQLAEAEAYEYTSQYTEILKEAEAPEELIQEFEQVLQVFEALNTVRSSEQTTGVLTSYASVQQVYEQNQADRS